MLTICVGKSTYARCGIITNVTPFEPEWEGFVTLEISNTTPLPAKIYANEGIAQVLFFESDEECQISYADKKGKYQKQTGHHAAEGPVARARSDARPKNSPGMPDSRPVLRREFMFDRFRDVLLDRSAEAAARAGIFGR